MGLTAHKLDLGDRKELWRLLERLDPQERLDFLRWCAGQTTSGLQGAMGVKVTSHTGTVHEAYLDLMHMEIIYGLDLNRAALELVRRCCRRR